MRQWTYRTDSIKKKGKGFDAKFESFLIKKGMEGWELCGMREFDESITCIFKQEVIIEIEEIKKK